MPSVEHQCTELVRGVVDTLRSWYHNFHIWCEVEISNINLVNVKISDQVRDTENLSYSGTKFDIDGKFRLETDINL